VGRHPRRGEALVDGGAREIVLLGQNVNAWEHEGRGLADLIRALADRWAGADPLHDQPPGRHERRADRAHGEVDKLMPYLHLPVQSGSDPSSRR
jgi:tRNA-2-methylthio-N6-dimethylallyladenosine synthase